MPPPPALSFPKLWPAYEPDAVPEDPVDVRSEHEVWQLHRVGEQERGAADVSLRDGDGLQTTPWNGSWDEP
jgi:hypothetical protein